MKATSLEANRKAEIFKTSHKRKILAVMDGKMDGNEIAELSGLTFVQVMRRMIDLVRDKETKECGSIKGFTLYQKIPQIV